MRNPSAISKVPEWSIAPAGVSQLPVRTRVPPRVPPVCRNVMVPSPEHEMPSAGSEIVSLRNHWPEIAGTTVTMVVPNLSSTLAVISADPGRLPRTFPTETDAIRGLEVDQ
jgi:hypothetical protein